MIASHGTIRMISAVNRPTGLLHQHSSLKRKRTPPLSDDWLGAESEQLDDFVNDCDNVNSEIPALNNNRFDDDDDDDRGRVKAEQNDSDAEQP